MRSHFLHNYWLAVCSAVRMRARAHVRYVRSMTVLPVAHKVSGTGVGWWCWPKRSPDGRPNNLHTPNMPECGAVCKPNINYILLLCSDGGGGDVCA